MSWFTGVVVPILAAVIGAAGGAFYADIKAYFSPDDLAGSWVLIGNEIGDQPGTHQLFEEQLTIKSHKGNVSGEGRQGDFRRVYSGFTKGEYIALAYETPAGIGIGVILADDKNGLKKEWLGYWKGKDCTVKKIVECPALIVKGNAGSPVVGAAKTKYSAFLSNACRDVAPSTCP
jgi:hypothetical protein